MTEIRNILLMGNTESIEEMKTMLANKASENDFTENTNKNIEEWTFEFNSKEDGNKKIKYRAISAIGIDDTNLTPQEVLTKLVEMVDPVKKEGFNQIFFVTERNESYFFSPDFFVGFLKKEIKAIDAYDLLRSIFFDKEVLKYTTFVRVGSEECKKNFCEDEKIFLWKGESEICHIHTFSPHKVVYLDNPPLEGANSEKSKEICEKSYKIFSNYLGKSCQKTYQSSNIDTSNERVLDYKVDEQKLKDKVKELEQMREGECKKRFLENKEIFQELMKAQEENEHQEEVQQFQETR